jgi:hypothetical protein
MRARQRSEERGKKERRDDLFVGVFIIKCVSKSSNSEEGEE